MHFQKKYCKNVQMFKQKTEKTTKIPSTYEIGFFWTGYLLPTLGCLECKTLSLCLDFHQKCIGISFCKLENVLFRPSEGLG
jgi:hypothetical protein